MQWSRHVLGLNSGRMGNWVATTPGRRAGLVVGRRVAGPTGPGPQTPARTPCRPTPARDHDQRRRPADGPAAHPASAGLPPVVDQPERQRANRAVGTVERHPAAARLGARRPPSTPDTGTPAPRPGQRAGPGAVPGRGRQARLPRRRRPGDVGRRPGRRHVHLPGRPGRRVPGRRLAVRGWSTRCRAARAPRRPRPAGPDRRVRGARPAHHVGPSASCRSAASGSRDGRSGGTREEGARWRQRSPH